MFDRLARAAAMLATLMLAACGSSSSQTSSSTALASHTSTSSTAASSSSSSAGGAQHHRTRTHKPAQSASSTTSAQSTSSATSTAGSVSTSTSATTRNAPPPAPAGTPSAPDGLAKTTGYGTYELCSGTCAGAVPSSIRRPLDLPRVSSGACPVSSGRGPIKPSPSVQLATQRFIGSAWLGARVTWTASPAYTGPVLIRGRRLGGSGAVGFGEGRVPYDELQLLSAGQGAPPVPGGGRAWLSFTRVESGGCYAYQVDGTSFSSVVVFKAGAE